MNRVVTAGFCIVLSSWVAMVSLGAEPVRRSGVALEIMRLPRPALQTQGITMSGGTTIWDGVFTKVQATRGQKAYLQSCAACHKDDFLGDNIAPPLAGTAFSARWAGSTVDDMVQTIKRSMPQEAPDSLTPQVYVDIVSRLLETNGSPAGPMELPTERATLKEILVTSRSN